MNAIHTSPAAAPQAGSPAPALRLHGHPPEGNMARAAAAEAAGTFVLVLAITSAAVAAALALPVAGPAYGSLAVPAAGGLALAALAASLGPVSGAHLNPAVTLGLAASRRFPWLYVPAYLAAQFAGAIAGAAVTWALYGQPARAAASLGATYPGRRGLRSLTGEAAHRGDRRLRAYFTRRAQAAIVAGRCRWPPWPHCTARTRYCSVGTGRALPLMILATLCGLAVLVMLTTGRLAGIRVIAALGVAAVIWGWGVAQYPVLLPGTAVTLANAGAPQATMVALVVLFAVAVVIIGPSFVLLLRLQSRRVLSAGEQGTLAAGMTAGGAWPPALARSARPDPARGSPAARDALLVTIAIAALIRRLWRR